MKVTPISAAIVALGTNKYRQTLVNEIEVEAGDFTIPAPPAPQPPASPPPPAPEPQPPAPAPGTGLLAATPNDMPNMKVIGPTDYIDPKDIPAPIPFTGPIPAGMRGVEPLAGKWRKIPLCGNPPWLYEQTPLLVDGKIERVLGQLGDDIALNAMPFLTGIGLDGKPVKKYPLRGGARGVGIATPYTAWHGHTPVRKDGTVNESVEVPLYLGLVASGEMMSIHKDGSMKILFRVPLPNGGFYNDYTLFEPRESNLFYAVNAPLAQIVEIDRNTNSVRTVFDGKAAGMKRLTSIRQVGQHLYVCDPDDGKIYRWHPATKVIEFMIAVPRVFWIDYFSNGDLCVITLNRTVHRVNAAGVGPDLLGKPGAGQSWVNCSVDRNGTCGERDSILALSTHGAANTDTYRITSEGINTRGFGQGGGRSTVGRLSGVGEALGHYPWNAEYHPHYGLILVQGFAECVPGFLCPEAEGQTYWANEDAQTEGVRMDGVLMERGQLLGNGKGLLLKEFSQIMTPRGGGLVTADHIAAMSYADAVAFLRAGMITRRPRTFTDGQCLAMLYAMYRQSQRFMREGRSLVDGLIKHINGTL